MSERTPSPNISLSARPVRYIAPPTEAVNTETASTMVSLAMHITAMVSPAGYSNSKSFCRACDSSTMLMINLATEFHTVCNTMRSVCTASTRRLPMLQSGLRILTRVPTHLRTPHRAAAKHLL